MGFFSGRATLARYRVKGRRPGQFGEKHLEKLAAHAMGKQRLAAGDGSEVGWTAGNHVLDTDFDLAKNIVDDALHFALRIDTIKLPPDLLRAYTAIELEALAKDGEPPGARQKRDARLAARERLEKEARDGRFIRRALVPLMWDGPSNELWVGTTSGAVLERLHGLFDKTFGHGFERLDAGPRAYQLAEVHGQTRGVEDARPTRFASGDEGPASVDWVPDEVGRAFLGNEFLVWLWYTLETASDSLALSDNSEAVAMFARMLVLECPEGRTGRQTLASDGPTQLPEARRALQAGKLPRRAGLSISRHERLYEFTLHAESLAITGAKLPAAETVDERARLEERVEQLRHLVETLDLIYESFCRSRLGADWTKELAQIRKWLQREKRPGMSATA
jgi:hypothetical protein